MAPSVHLAAGPRDTRYQSVHMSGQDGCAREGAGCGWGGAGCEREGDGCAREGAGFELEEDTLKEREREVKQAGFWKGLQVFWKGLEGDRLDLLLLLLLYTLQVGLPRHPRPGPAHRPGRGRAPPPL